METPDTAVEFPNASPHGAYTASENRTITSQLYAVLAKIHAGTFRSTPLHPHLIQDFHYAIFCGVRSFAGKFRKPGDGSDRLVFGPNRSSRAQDTTSEIEQACREWESRISELEQLHPTKIDVDGIISVAVLTHARIIQVHPFQDGNGRTSRAVMSYVLNRLGCPPIPVETSKDDYNRCLNALFGEQRDSRPLLDLFFRLAREAWGSNDNYEHGMP